MLRKLQPDSPGYHQRIGTYYLLCNELGQAADHFEKALAEHDASATMLLQMEIAKKLRASEHWPRLAELLNLPHAGSFN